MIKTKLIKEACSPPTNTESESQQLCPVGVALENHQNMLSNVYCKIRKYCVILPV